MAGPLEGIRVIDWTQWQMGPVAGAMLADLGASVIHIENRVTGDPARALRLTGIQDELPYGRCIYFEFNNRGKKGIVLDLAKEKGKEVVYRLVRNSDVFLNNMRQGVPERLKLDYETLRQYNPKLIYAAGSGYGTKGPEANQPAFDMMGHARSGAMRNIVGEPDLPPLNLGSGSADQMGAITTAYGILAALVARERFGVGQKVDVSHLGSMMLLQGLSVAIHLYSKQFTPQPTRRAQPGRKNSRNPLYNRYPCKDGTWLALGHLQPDRQWPTVCKGLGIEHLIKDTKFEDATKRAENAAELIAIMDGIFITKSAQEWVKTLREAGDVICTVVQSIPDLENDPQVLANNYIVDCQHEAFGPTKALGLPIELSETPGEINCTAPEFGQHTEEVLIEVGGYSWEEISELRQEEVI